ncbi:MAG: hypothetical protein R3F21_10885 [Myxococcota bacterium]
MPRDLSDVLHFFLPELGGDLESSPAFDRPFVRRRETTPGAAARRSAPARPVETSRLPLSVLGVPIGERDVVHAAYTWNLAREIIRLGGSSTIVTPRADRDSPLWSTHDPAGLADVEVVYSAAEGLTGLRRHAERVARERGRTAGGGIVFARIPPAWLTEPSPEDEKPDGFGRTPSDDPIRWLLTFTSSRPREVDSLFERIQSWVRGRPGLEIGVTVHGVHQIEAAREAFDGLARSCDERLGLPLASYGLLVDDLDLYRAIAAGRPMHAPERETPAARALTDVARLLYEDARSRVLG